MTLVHRPTSAASPDPFALTPPPGDAAILESRLPGLRVRLLRQARFAVHDDSLAEDLVQDTLIAVFEQHAKRRGVLSAFLPL